VFLEVPVFLVVVIFLVSIEPKAPDYLLSWLAFLAASADFLPISSACFLTFLASASCALIRAVV
jgi:hypothetical protein